MASRRGIVRCWTQELIQVLKPTPAALGEPALEQGIHQGELFAVVPEVLALVDHQQVELTVLWETTGGRQGIRDPLAEVIRVGSGLVAGVTDQAVAVGVEGPRIDGGEPLDLSDFGEESPEVAVKAHQANLRDRSRLELPPTGLESEQRLTRARTTRDTQSRIALHHIEGAHLFGAELEQLLFHLIGRHTRNQAQVWP